jgi:hypothetical protein
MHRVPKKKQRQSQSSWEEGHNIIGYAQLLKHLFVPNNRNELRFFTLSSVNSFHCCRSCKYFHNTQGPYWLIIGAMRDSVKYSRIMLISFSLCLCLSFECGKVWNRDFSSMEASFETSQFPLSFPVHFFLCLFACFSGKLFSFNKFFK